jgi:hypothetical protein
MKGVKQSRLGIFGIFAAESDKNDQLLQGGSMKRVLNPTPPE